MISLQSLHTFGLPSRCQRIISVTSASSVVAYFRRHPQRNVILIGAGSNCVFTQDFAGDVLQLNLKGVQVSEDADAHYLTVAAGENWHQLVCWCLQQGIHGFENLAMIPGTVGAAPIQNIGAYGVEIHEFIASVDLLDLTTLQRMRLHHAECEFGYRESIFKQQLKGRVLITQVNFRLAKSRPPVADYAELKELQQPTAQAIFDKVVQVRQQKLPDPKVIGNAGSFFKNPVISQSQYQALQQGYPQLPCYPLTSGQVKVPAAWLIDTLGFKGKSEGGIGCHLTQPLVLVNHGDGTGAQLLSLARQIRSSVHQTFGICLENEVNLMGATGEIQL